MTRVSVPVEGGAVVVECGSVLTALRIAEDVEGVGVDPLEPSETLIPDFDARPLVTARGGRVFYCVVARFEHRPRGLPFVRHKCTDITPHIKSCLGGG